MRHPLVHFLLLGALLFVAVRLHQAPETPTPEGDEELLVRAALELGFDRTDPIVLRRLVRDMRFLAPDDTRDADALVDDALALGLQHGDLVVRRRLAQKMKLLAFARADAREPTEAELRDVWERERARWVEPPRVRLTHVYLSRDRRGARLEDDARALLRRVVSHDPRRVPALGDPFLLGAEHPLLSEAELAARFGPEFASAAMAAAPGCWSGPLRSSYGLHLVWVHERTPGGERDFAAVRGEVRELLREERRRRELEELVAALRRGS